MSDSVETPTTAWQEIPLKSVVEVVDTCNPEDDFACPFMYIDISSIDGAKNKVACPKLLSPCEAPSRARQIVKAGDVLFSTVRTYLRNIALVPPTLDGQIASTGFCVLRAGCCTSPKFLFYMVQTDAFLEPLNALQRGTSYPAVRSGDVLSQRIPLPPLPEQQRIVEKIEELFTRLDAGLANLRHAKAQIQRYRQAVLRDACPSGAPWRSIGSLITEKPANGRSVTTQEGGFPVLRLTALRDGHIDLSETKEGAWTENEASSYLVERGDFLVSRGNGSIRLVGLGGVVPDSTRRVAFPDTLIRLRFSPSELSLPFVCHIWNSRTVRRQIERMAKTTAGIYKINQADIRSIQIPVPPLDEQAAIVAEIERHFSIADAADAALAQAESQASALRQSILKEAFAGRLVPAGNSNE